jgi:pyruvate formate lyase activating enzyme
MSDRGREASMTPHPARWWHLLDTGKIQCDLCPRDCRLQDGQRGFCFVRERVGDELFLSTYGRSSGFCVDPIEKKPLNHFYPGSSVLSFGTAGCNLGCRFCQNWDMSKARALDVLADQALPATIAARARELGCKSVAFTYNDPVIFAEYAMDVADACHAEGVATVAVTAGYIHAEPRRAFYEKIDAANVDLKAFTEDFYHRHCFAHLGPVLETLEFLVHETSVWTEVTTLLMPGLNDSEAEVGRLVEWFAQHLGREVPLHFSAFHPDFEMLKVPPTPPRTIERARRQGLSAGLHHVYTGNVHDAEGDTTFCASCGASLIERDWYELHAYRLTKTGGCPQCGASLAGRFDAEPGHFGRRREPVRMGDHLP